MAEEGTVYCDKCGYTVTTPDVKKSTGETCTRCHKGTYKKVK